MKNALFEKKVNSNKNISPTYPIFGGLLQETHFQVYEQVFIIELLLKN